MNPKLYIAERRKALGWSQAKLAYLADELSPATIVLIEKGRRSPSLSTLSKIADALGCEVVDLFKPA